MKKLILALLLLPAVTHAQTWRVAISGGATIISKPGQAPPAYTDSKMKPGGIGMLSISYRFSEDFDIGIDVAAANLVRTGDIVVYDQYGNPVGTYSDAGLHVGKIAFIATPSLSYHLHDFYLGPQLGYFVTSGGDNGFNFYSLKDSHYYFKDVRGFVAGAHLGYAHDLSKRFALFGALRGNYLNGSQMANGVSVYGFNMFQLQLTAGLSYEY